MLGKIVKKTIGISMDIDELLHELHSGLTPEEIAHLERMQSSVRLLLKLIDARLIEAYHNI